MCWTTNWGRITRPPTLKLSWDCSSLNDSIGNLSISSGASGFSGTLKYRGLHKYKEKYGTTKSTSTLLSRSSLHSLQTLFQKSPRSPIARPTERPPSPPISPRVKVVFPYSPQKHDELNLKEGELITILRKNDDGWWEGVNENGHHGVFPSNYVIQWWWVNKDIWDLACIFS